MKGHPYYYSTQILDRVLLEALPKLPHEMSWDYEKEWGDPNTSQRLKKITFSIAQFIKNAKGKKNPGLNKAIDDWSMDLDWIKKSFYDGRFDKEFHWPFI